MSDPAHHWEFEALGTHWVVSTPGPLPPAGTDAVTAELDRIDRAWSRFRDDSMVADMARTPGRFPIPATDQPLIDWYDRLYRLTGGAVSPFVGQSLINAGYDAQYTLRRIGGIAPCPAWDDVIASHDGEFVTTTAAVFDAGAAGKGFAIDRVAGIVAGHADRFIVDGSGDMVIAGSDPVRVALEHPGDPSKAIGVATLGSGSICASAGNRRAWGERGDGGRGGAWHHIIDPTTGTPTWDVLATWVIAPTAMLADGLSTALFFVPPERLREQSALLGTTFDYVVVRHNGTVDYSDNPDWELFL